MDKKLIDKETPKKVIKVPYKAIYGNKLEDSKTLFYNGCPVCKKMLELMPIIAGIVDKK